MATNPWDDDNMVDLSDIVTMAPNVGQPCLSSSKNMLSEDSALRQDTCVSVVGSLH